MDDDTSPHPLDFQALATAQNQDNTLLQELQADPQHYARVLMDHNVQSICYMPQANAPWKICIPDALLDHMITWYHLVLSHVGSFVYTKRCRFTFTTMICRCAFNVW